MHALRICKLYIGCMWRCFAWSGHTRLHAAVIRCASLMVGGHVAGHVTCGDPCMHAEDRGRGTNMVYISFLIDSRD